MSDFRTFDDFWPFYVREHSKPLTRWFHYAGTATAMASLAAFARTRRPLFLAGAVVTGYGPAWLSHFVIQGNRPATWKHPLWSLMGDVKMFELMTRGLMDAEVARVMATPSDAPSQGATAEHGANGVHVRVTDPSQAN